MILSIAHHSEDSDIMRVLRKRLQMVARAAIAAGFLLGLVVTSQAQEKKAYPTLGTIEAPGSAL